MNAPEQTAFALRSESGASVSLTGLASAGILGQCGGVLSLVLPAEPLDPAERWRLVSTLPSGSASESEPFGVAEHEPTPEAVQIELTAALERVEPFAPSSGLCADVLLDGRTVDTLAHVRVGPRRAPLLVVASVTDGITGTLGDARALLPSAAGGDLELTLPLPAEAGRCVDVQLFDLRGVSRFRETLCPEPDAPVTRSLELSLATVPETPPPVEDGGGCSLSRGNAGRSLLATSALAAALLVLGRRFGGRSRVG